MDMNNKYLIDSDVLVTAHRTLFPFDIAPGFWKQLIDKASPKIVFIEGVSDEILKGRDELADWYSENKDGFNVLGIPEDAVIKSYRHIINNINKSEKYKQSKKREFASTADSWLCAYGLAYDSTIVTCEKHPSDSRGRIPIPDVCLEFGIRCIDLLQFMREMKFKLI